MAGSGVLGPRLVVAGTHSGAGKTSVTTGLLAALAARGLRVGSAKVGPDFIDPGYHSLATGRPSRNLDVRLSGASSIVGTAARAAAGADLLLVEGVMGLFDGASDGRGHRAAGSTAHVARLLAAPVVLVVDAASMSGSVAAVVHGYASLDPDVAVAGVVLNRVGSPGHEELLRESLLPLGVPVLGAIRRDAAFEWRDRHLGLVPVAESPAAVAASLARLGDAVAASVDLEAVVALARTAPAVGAPAAARPVAVPGRPRIALAGGPAFSFTYPELLESLSALGAEVVPFDPAVDAALPPGCTGLVAGGGFPEVHAGALAANRPLLEEVRRRAGGPDLVTWAECGGLLWLARSLDGHALAGAVDAEGTMTTRLSLGYRDATTTVASWAGPAGTALVGHEFHYSQLTPTGTALQLEGRFGSGPGGFAGPHLLASYLHVHPTGSEHLVRRFVEACAAATAP